MSARIYDCIVLGTGGVGSAALAHLARHGLRVLGLDQYPWAHDRGSSHGQSRIIRQAYFEHPDYVPLLRRAYALWRELEAETGTKLFGQVGVLLVGRPDGAILSGVAQSARQHGLSIEWLTDDRIRKDFPQLPDPGPRSGALETNAGYLLVEASVRAHLEVARRAGAEWRQEEVVQWNAGPEAISIETNKQRYETNRLVVSAGAWASRQLPTIGVGLQVLLKDLCWYPPSDARLNASAGCPAFLYELEEGCFYGVPSIDRLGVKLAEHSGGLPIDRPGTERDIGPTDEQRRIDAFAATFPGLGRVPTHHARCYYTMSPDEHFLVDLDPQDPRVVLVAGLSGHGFKFTSVLGQIAAELAIDGTSSLPMDFLRLSRFGQPAT